MKAVILAGGGGTRLYPLSTPEKPKQFLPLVSDKSMLEETIDRLDFLSTEDIFIAINKDHSKLTKKLCPQIPKKNIIIEPELRDTASCIGFAAAIIEKRFPGEVMVIIYADHLIGNKKEFQKKIKVASQIAQEYNTLNIVEVEAKEPNTNYGYVKTGKLFKKIEQENGDETEIYNLQNFTEKPDLETAKKFLADGSYLWNTGIYVWKTKTLLEKFRQIEPDSYEKFMEMMEKPEKISQIYPTLKKISIDFAIMEKVDPSEVKIIKADLDWSDIGNFDTLYAELEKRGRTDKIEEFKKIQEQEAN